MQYFHLDDNGDHELQLYCGSLDPDDIDEAAVQRLKGLLRTRI